MNLEVGKKYKRCNTVVEVKFFDKTGHAWGLSTEGCAQCISSSKHDWQEVTDTPDPGEGWRLLEVGERLEEGDQFYNSVADWVGACLTWSSGVVLKGSVYRRRIAPQYVPYTWEDREELRGRWYREKSTLAEVMIKRLSINLSGNLLVNEFNSSVLLANCEWLDGTPCGKVVK